MKREFEEIRAYIRSSDSSERYWGLILAGEQRESAVVPLATQAMLGDENTTVRAMAAWALNRVASPVTVPALIEALYDQRFDVRVQASRALVRIAKKTIPDVVVPDVVDVMCDPDHDTARHMAYLVLQLIGSEQANEAIRRYWNSSD